MAVGHALHDVDQRGFLVVTGLPHVEHPVIPMIAAHERVELEGRRRAGSEHQARALALVDVERLTVAPAAHLDRLAAAHERVVARVEREQHPHPAVGVGAQHDDVAVVREPRVDARLIAAVVIVVIEPDFDRWVVAHDSSGRRGRGSERGAYEREHQWQQHWSILYIPVSLASDQEACRFP